MDDDVTRRTVAHHRSVIGAPVPVVLAYRRDQPWEVTIRLLTGQNHGRGVTWVLARDLLALGLHGPVGLGDIRLRPTTTGRVAMELDNGDDTPATFHLGVGALAAFLDATARVVPFGTEHVHTDLNALCDALRRAA